MPVSIWLLIYLVDVPAPRVSEPNMLRHPLPLYKRSALELMTRPEEPEVQTKCSSANQNVAQCVVTNVVKPTQPDALLVRTLQDFFATDQFDYISCTFAAAVSNIRLQLRLQMPLFKGKALPTPEQSTKLKEPELYIQAYEHILQQIKASLQFLRKVNQLRQVTVQTIENLIDEDRNPERLGKKNAWVREKVNHTQTCRTFC